MGSSCFARAFSVGAPRAAELPAKAVPTAEKAKIALAI